MSRLIFLDQSLKNLGGHHFDYALHVVRAAESLGFETVLATHASFRDSQEFPKSCDIVPVFRHTVYNKYSDFSPRKGRSRPDRRAISSLKDRWRQRQQASGYRRYVRHFTQDCKVLFDTIAHRSGDHVFLATISDLELLGLAGYVNHEPSSHLAEWHCQFHFNIFKGRPAEYSSQSDALERCQKRFNEAIEQLKYQSVHFYNTSDELADQYQRLGVANFESLNYPINPELSQVDTSKSISDDKQTVPLRVTLAGAVRQEKGQERLHDVIRQIVEGDNSARPIQLVIQRKRRSRFRKQQVDVRPLVPTDGSNHLSIDYVHHPLDDQSYRELMKSADVGLFLYDGRTYYARRAGVMGEFLSLGTPVIVPAGCWLSEQLRPSHDNYCSALASQSEPIACQADAFDSRKPALIRPDESLTFVIPTPAKAKSLLLGADFDGIDHEVEFLRVQYGDHSESSSDRRTANSLEPAVVMSSKSNNADASVMIPIPTELQSTSHVTLKVRSAFGQQALRLNQFRAWSVQSPAQPLGIVGLVAADDGQVPRLMNELSEHFPHYRASARAFAGEWYDRHDAHRVIKRLARLGDAGRESKAA